MRAVVQQAYGDPEVLQVQEVPTPSVAAGSVLIRVMAAGVNFHDSEGRRRPEVGVPVPGVPGTDVAGTVVDVADGVTGFRPGDRVLALVRHGGYAEYAVAPARLTVSVPAGVGFADAVSVPVAGLTAALLAEHLDSFGPRPTVVVQAAAGSVGRWLGCLLPARGALAVGVVSSEAKSVIAREAGYPEVVVHPPGAPAAALIDAVNRSTRRRGADLVLDSVGGPDFAASFELLRPEGRVVSFGRAAGPPATAGLEQVLLGARRNLSLHTFFLTRAMMTRMATMAPLMSRLLALMAGGDFRPITTTIDLAQAAQAHRLLESRGTVGKIVLLP